MLILRGQQVSDFQTQSKSNVIIQPKIQGSLVVPNQSLSPIIIPKTTTSPVATDANQRGANAVVTHFGSTVNRVPLPLTSAHIISSSVTHSMVQSSTVLTTTSAVGVRPAVGSRTLNFGDEDSLDGSSIIPRQRRDSGSSVNSGKCLVLVSLTKFC